jgi:hypothetical protein
VQNFRDEEYSIIVDVVDGMTQVKEPDCATGPATYLESRAARTIIKQLVEVLRLGK